MLVTWLSKEQSTVPANASHQVGIGAFILNDKQEVPLSDLSLREMDKTTTIRNVSTSINKY